jgi:hypothetical protein
MHRLAFRKPKPKAAAQTNRLLAMTLSTYSHPSPISRVSCMQAMGVDGPIELGLKRHGKDMLLLHLHESTS